MPAELVKKAMTKLIRHLCVLTISGVAGVAQSDLRQPTAKPASSHSNVAPVSTNVLNQSGPKATSSKSIGDWQARATRFLSWTDDKLDEKSVYDRKFIFLLKQENSLILSTLEHSSDKIGVSEAYGETYSAYYDQLVATVLRIAQRGNEYAYKVLASGSYNPDSLLAHELVEHWPTTLPELEAVVQSKSAIMRQQAAEVLASILKNHFEQLEPDEKRRIERLVQSAGAKTDDPAWHFQYLKDESNISFAIRMKQEGVADERLIFKFTHPDLDQNFWVAKPLKADVRELRSLGAKDDLISVIRVQSREADRASSKK